VTFAAGGAKPRDRCDDGGMTRSSRSFAVLAFVLFGAAGVFAAGCSGQNPYQASATANSASIDNAGAPASGSEDNVFLPEDANVSSCVGTLERADCGSKSKGGWRMYLTFAVLLSGMAFIGWRIARSIKARDAVMNAGTEDGAPRAATEPNMTVPTGSDQPTRSDSSTTE